MTRARNVFAAVLAVLTLLLSGCGSAPAGDPPRELVWAVGEITVAAAQRVADEWNQAHPDGVHVRVVALPQLADEQRNLLAIELIAGIPEFDVLELDVIWTAEFASRDWLLDLDEQRPEVEAAALPAAVRTGVWDDRLWAVPFTTDVGLLYYRMDLVGDPPGTWSEMTDTASRVASEHGMAGVVTDGYPGEGLVVQFLERLWAEGGNLTVEDGTVVLDQEPAVEALTSLRRDYRTGLLAPGWETMQLEDVRTVFQRGQAVFMRSWPYAYEAMLRQDPTGRLREQTGLAPLPAGPGGVAAPALGGHNLAVSRFSRNPGPAVEFLRFATLDPRVQNTLATEYSLAPTLSATYRELAGHPVIGLVGKVLPTARNRPVTPYWAEISMQIRQQISAATVGRVPPRDAAGAMRAGITAIVTR